MTRILVLQTREHGMLACHDAGPLTAVQPSSPIRQLLQSDTGMEIVSKIKLKQRFIHEIRAMWKEAEVVICCYPTLMCTPFLHNFSIVPTSGHCPCLHPLVFHGYSYARKSGPFLNPMDQCSTNMFCPKPRQGKTRYYLMSLLQKPPALFASLVSRNITDE